MAKNILMRPRQLHQKTDEAFKMIRRTFLGWARCGLGKFSPGLEGG